jgi:hypothetical protein
MRHDTTPEGTHIFMNVYPETLAKTGRTREGVGEIGVVSGFRRGGWAPLVGAFARRRECRERSAAFDIVRTLMAERIASAIIRPPASECPTKTLHVV